MSAKEESLNETNILLEEPKTYKVIMHNDDYTTMEFVVDLLINLFHKSTIEANNIMMNVHINGSGIAGEYIYDIAVTKKTIGEKLAANEGFPLKITIEEV